MQVEEVRQVIEIAVNTFRAEFKNDLEEVKASVKDVKADVKELSEKLDDLPCAEHSQQLRTLEKDCDKVIACQEKIKREIVRVDKDVLEHKATHGGAEAQSKKTVDTTMVVIAVITAVATSIGTALLLR
jgi:predicted  nucleic acid-binding Zn-ribbon protein